MTLIETIPAMSRPTPPGRGLVGADDRTRDGGWHRGRMKAVRSGPTPTRPGGAPLRYRGSAATMSRSPHHRRPAPPAAWVTTFGLALLAALITGWLGLVAQFGGAAAGQTAAVPDQLGVVRVQDGESLTQLAARVAPGVPTGQVVVRIRELNQLDSAALDAGQTLIAPIG